MSKNMMGKNLRQSIRRSLGRYIAIVLIIALGSAIFVGLKTTKSDMVATGAEYMEAQNMFDLRLVSSYGWDLESVEEISALEGVASAEGVFTLDALAVRSDTEVERVYKLYAIPETVNKVRLLGGRMPEVANECLADGAYADDSVLGTTYTISAGNSGDTLDSLTCHTFTVVGYVSTPLYMDMSRGSTTIGNGTVSGYLYIPAESFDMDYYTQIDVTIDGDNTVYTEEYNDAMDAAADTLEPDLNQIACKRYEELLQEAEDAYQEGLAEYTDGLLEYADGKQEAEDALEEGCQTLVDAEQEVSEGWKALEEADLQLIYAQREVDAAQKTLDASWAEFEEQKEEAYEELDAQESQLWESYYSVTDGIAQIEEGLAQQGISEAELDSVIGQLNQGITALDANIQQLEPVSQLPEYAGLYQNLVAQRETYVDQLAQLQAVQTQLAELNGYLAVINDGFDQLEAGRETAEREFSAAQAQLEEAQAQLEEAQQEIYTGWWELDEGEKELLEAEEELVEGWKTYYDSRETAQRELDDAQRELDKAQEALADAREQIDRRHRNCIFWTAIPTWAINPWTAIPTLWLVSPRYFPPFSCWWRLWYASLP